MAPCPRKAAASSEAAVTPSSFPYCPRTVCGYGGEKNLSGGFELTSLKSSFPEGSAEVGGGLKSGQILSEMARRSEDEDIEPFWETQFVSCSCCEFQPEVKEDGTWTAKPQPGKWRFLFLFISVYTAALLKFFGLGA